MYELKAIYGKSLMTIQHLKQDYKFVKYTGVNLIKL